MMIRRSRLIGALESSIDLPWQTGTADVAADRPGPGLERRVGQHLVGLDGRHRGYQQHGQQQGEGTDWQICPPSPDKAAHSAGTPAGTLRAPAATR